MAPLLLLHDHDDVRDCDILRRPCHRHSPELASSALLLGNVFPLSAPIMAVPPHLHSPPLHDLPLFLPALACVGGGGGGGNCSCPACIQQHQPLSLPMHFFLSPPPSSNAQPPAFHSLPSSASSSSSSSPPLTSSSSSAFFTAHHPASLQHSYAASLQKPSSHEYSSFTAPDLMQNTLSHLFPPLSTPTAMPLHASAAPPAMPANAMLPEPPHASETSPYASHPPESPTLHAKHKPLQCAAEETRMTGGASFGTVANTGRVTRPRRKSVAGCVDSNNQPARNPAVRKQDYERLPSATEYTLSKIDEGESCENNDNDEDQTDGDFVPKTFGQTAPVNGQCNENAVSNRCGSRSTKRRKVTANDSGSSGSNVTTASTVDINGCDPSATTAGRPSARFKATDAELAILHGEFERDAFPNTLERQRIADGLGMEPRQVQFWFQNRRAKAKARGIALVKK
ncbi:hypothetical protein HDU84_001076 [Entophlyctis sp. JEL0112]|nr:hypothetical protein HDU84_001076 [Entophlyctis sp. JEL0112]